MASLRTSELARATALVDGDLIASSIGGADSKAIDWGDVLDHGHSRLTIGGATDKLVVADDGSIRLHGAATQWEDLRIEPVARAAGANVPAFEKWLDDSAGTSRGCWLYSFDHAVLASQKELHFSMQMPHSWAGTAISMHVHWIGSTSESAKDVVWGLEYAWQDIGTAFGDTAIVESSTALIPDDANIVAYRHYISGFADIPPGTSADGLSSILIGRLYRASASASDTYAGKCGLLYVDAHYEVDSLGSREEYSK